MEEKGPSSLTSRNVSISCRNIFPVDAIDALAHVLEVEERPIGRLEKESSKNYLVLSQFFCSL